ncbi:tyrosine-protein phosphatase [Nocardia sp. alder85J]|uniref:tyrosine-protein phosphatase n=1 Tax=Nocardia sp. alder85J TaxID=2862949 RepID=UPI001CD3CA17|nr:tyrosine-protein phosphatase [Nocardia sp. alder85J]MCX4095976.1 tyrosine-protein phosphatase [Nocardia sp. alder85J]
MSSAQHDQFLISGTFNFRDVGGLRAADGAKVRGGVLLRSAQLGRVDADGHATLRELGVATVFDLRGLLEIEHLGADALPDEVRLVVSPFDPELGRTPPHEMEVAPVDARQGMHDVYRAFPLMPPAGAAITAIAESVVRGDGAVLVHCAAGKDRTGWAIATLLRAVGVIEAETVADYLRSNAAVDALRQDVVRNGRAELPPEVLGVSAEYLAAATASMHDNYGDLDGYLAAIGLTPELRTGLRTRLLE